MKPEDCISDPKRPFTGAEYAASLRDGRQVYLNGARVEDVTVHPAFRNAVRSVAHLYDLLHEGVTKDTLTCPTDTGSGGYTHRFFRAAKTREELVAQQRAIAEWARFSYGWMGRTPDYKASLMNTLEANADYYGEYSANARAWYRRAQQAVLFMNHAIVNPPVDRSRPLGETGEICVSVRKETDAGLVVSGAKTVATSAALTHYNLVGQTTPTDDPKFAALFIVPISSPGVKLICRSSYEQDATASGGPWNHPLASRFDENDAILILDQVLVPWENVLLHRQAEKIPTFFEDSGFVNGFCFQGCTRFAVKLDFLVGLFAKALRASGSEGFRGNQAMLGEVIAWRNLFWSLSDCMASNPMEWKGGQKLPNLRAAVSYRALAPDAYGRIRELIEKAMASALICLPSSAADLKNPEIARLLKRHLPGAAGSDFRDRIKLMKLLWEAVGTEFAGRQSLYERNYAGNHEEVRIQAFLSAKRGGQLDAMMELAERCLADYDENGWNADTWRSDSPT